MNESRFEPFERAIQTLKKAVWFKHGKWITRTHPFPREKPQGITFHLFRKNWLNEDGLGIHFESYFDFDPRKPKRSYLALHLMHHDCIPGSRTPRKLLAAALWKIAGPEMSKLEKQDFEFRAGKFGLQPFTCRLDATRPDFEERVVENCALLAQLLGDRIDEALLQVSGDKLNHLARR